MRAVSSVALCIALAGLSACGTDKALDDTAVVEPPDDTAGCAPSEEVCDGVDNDCDGEVDGAGAADATTVYDDADGDGYGAPGTGVTACEHPTAGAPNGDDCDDGDATISPGAEERCDEVDNDCDGDTDEADAVDAPEWYADADHDGVGSEEATIRSCVQPPDSAATGGDCDDTDDAVSPLLEERCGDGKDNDCDGEPGTCGPDGDLILRGGAALRLGEQPGDWAGYALAGAGDTDGDGFDDMLVGALCVSVVESCAGAVYVLNGPIGGPGSLGAADAVLLGEAKTDYAGQAVSGAGDLDGDGLDDVLVGAYRSDRGAADGGAVYGLFGPLSGSLSLSAADLTLTGVGASDQAGSAVAALGDADGDGWVDLAVAADFLDRTTYGNEGAVYVVYGPVTSDLSLAASGLTITGDAVADRLGDGLSGAGDVDGDGLADLVVGVSGADPSGGDGAGAALVYLGLGEGDLAGADADLSLWGEALGDGAGTTVLGGADADSDGYDDLLVAAPKRDSAAGVIYVLSGPLSAGSADLGSAGARFEGGVGDYAGTNMDFAGDVNGDGDQDLIIGAYAYTDGVTPYLGLALLVYGPVEPGSWDLREVGTGSIYGARFPGTAEKDYAGRGVAGAGDTDNDGCDDLLIGAYAADDGGVDAGLVAMWLGDGF